MKNFAAILIYLITSFSFADIEKKPVPDSNNFKYFSDIVGTVKSNQLYQIHLNHEILSKCASDCSDLRVFDLKGNETPYVILDHKSPELKPISYSFEIVDYKEEPGSAVITIRLPEKFEPIVRLKLNISDHDFKKEVQLQGSSDMQNWSLLAQDSIYDFSSQVDLRKTEIEFAKSSYRYYRLTLNDSSKPDNETGNLSIKYNGLDLNLTDSKPKTIRINGFTGETESEKDATVYDQIVFDKFVPSLDKNQNTSVILEANLPLNKVSFDIGNPYFYRKVRVYYSDSGKDDSYQFLAEQKIYRFSLSNSTESKTDMECYSSKHRFYKVVVENGNNPVLELRNIKLEWVSKNLFWVGLSESDQYKLRFGNAAAEKPNYDLGNFVNQSNWMKQSYQELKALAVQENVHYNPALPKYKKDQYEKLALRLVVICLVIAIGVWLYRLMRQIA